MSDALDAIGREAAAQEAEQEAVQAAIDNPPPLVDPGEAWATIPAAMGGILAIAMPELKDAYTPAACLRWGQAMHVLAEKHGWDASETMARFAPEIGIVMASVPLVVPTVVAIRARRDAAEAEKAARRAPTIEPVQQGADQAAGGADGSA